MKRIGLTGGFGSGKSIVSRFFKDLGIPVVDTDIIARNVVAPGTPLLEKIRRQFGDTVIQQSGELDREALAQFVFRDSRALRKLDALMHPIIGKKVEVELANFTMRGHDIAVIDVPLLFECAWDKDMDATVVVWAPEETCIIRLQAQRGFTPKDIAQRINSQLSLEEKRRRADYVIDNSGEAEKTRAATEAILKKMQTDLDLVPSEHLS